MDFKRVQKASAGFTLVETLVVVAITCMVAGMVMVSFSTYNSTEALAKDEGRVVAVFERARSLTLDSYNSSQYGVHIASSTLTIFQGSTYSAGATTNIVTTLNTKVQVQKVTLVGGGVDVIFNRLTGETSETGTTTISLITATTTTRSVTIFGTGLIQPN